MNYKIAKTMLILCIVYLLSFYILKFAFPNILLQAITSPTILKLGEFINRFSWLGYIIRFFTSFLTFYLFCCASCGRFKFKWLELLFITIFVVITNLVCYFLPSLYTHTSIALMFLSAFCCKGKLSYSAISFTIHGYLSCFLTEIRGFETILVKVTELGVLSWIILSFEVYIWLSLLAIIFYFKESKKV